LASGALDQVRRRVQDILNAARDDALPTGC
jgi:hypothetical protein